MSAFCFLIIALGDPNYRDSATIIAAAPWHELMLHDPIAKDEGVYVKPNVWMVHPL